VEAASRKSRFQIEALVSTPIVSEFGHARSLEETYEWMRPKLRKVPITRVYDATPLDFLGVPIWAAVTPLAIDLTVHAGKGLTPQASRLSAIMEATERVCAESVEPNRLVRASYNEMAGGYSGVEPISPELFDLPFDSTYDPASQISWIEGFDLIQKRAVYVANDVAITPAREGVCRGVETNGLASGNTHLEAIVHALCEIIERDAKSHDEFCSLFAEQGDSYAMKTRMIDPLTLPERPIALVEGLIQRGVKVRLQKLENPANIPVYGVAIIDTDFPGNAGYQMVFGGYGCDLNPERAALRAITEAAQSHTIVTLAARDAFEGTRAAPDRAARLRRNLEIIQPESLIGFDPCESASSGDLLVDMNIIVDRLAKAGFEHCIVVDLTRKDLAVPVVRALVPGLSGPYGFANRRPNFRLLMNIV
jgi:thioglycine synthase